LEGGKVDEPVSFGGAQIGDMDAGGVAGGNLTNIRVSSDQAISLLSADVQAVLERLERLERVEMQHISERQALTRMLTQLATESRTVSDVHDLLLNQIDGNTADRAQRRRYLDSMLSALIVISMVNVGFHIFRVFRRSGRAA
jgi:hypothetical protein